MSQTSSTFPRWTSAPPNKNTQWSVTRPSTASHGRIFTRSCHPCHHHHHHHTHRRRRPPPAGLDCPFRSYPLNPPPRGPRVFSHLPPHRAMHGGSHAPPVSLIPSDSPFLPATPLPRLPSPHGVWHHPLPTLFPPSPLPQNRQVPNWPPPAHPLPTLPRITRTDAGVIVNPYDQHGTGSSIVDFSRPLQRRALHVEQIKSPIYQFGLSPPSEYY